MSIARMSWEEWVEKHSYFVPSVDGEVETKDAWERRASLRMGAVLNLIKRELNDVLPDSQDRAGGFRYFSAHQVDRETSPLLEAYGVSVSQDVVHVEECNYNGVLRVGIRVYSTIMDHFTGWQERREWRGAHSSTNCTGLSAAITNAKKTHLMSLFGLISPEIPNGKPSPDDKVDTDVMANTVLTALRTRMLTKIADNPSDWSVADVQLYVDSMTVHEMMFILGDITQAEHERAIAQQG